MGERVTQLEEQFRLAQSRRFAPFEADDTDNDGIDDALVLPDTGLPDAPTPTRGKPGRKPLPAHLPRQRIEYDLPESEKACPGCAHALHRLGEDMGEQLHIEVKASVLQHVRFK